MIRMFLVVARLLVAAGIVVKIREVAQDIAWVLGVLLLFAIIGDSDWWWRYKTKRALKQLRQRRKIGKGAAAGLDT